MKKIKHFILAAMSLGVVLVGCDSGNGDDGGEATVDSRGKVAGVYPVKVETAMTGIIYTDMTLAKEGDADLKASATVEVPNMGAMSIDLVLSELKEYDSEAGQAVTGYLFRIAEQELSIAGAPIKLKGTGAYTDGYDGRVYKNADTAFISFEIADASGIVKVSVETGVYIDNRGKVAGTYPIKLTASLSALGEVFTDLELVAYGENELRAYGKTSIPNLPWAGEIGLEIILSDLKEFDEENGQAVTGYYFKIHPQEFNGLPLVGDQTVAGTGEYDGYDGKVYMSDTEASFGLKVINDLEDLWLLVEPAE